MPNDFPSGIIMYCFFLQGYNFLFPAGWYYISPESNCHYARKDLWHFILMGNSAMWPFLFNVYMYAFIQIILIVLTLLLIKHTCILTENKLDFWSQITIYEWLFLWGIFLYILLYINVILIRRGVPQHIWNNIIYTQNGTFYL